MFIFIHNISDILNNITHIINIYIHIPLPYKNYRTTNLIIDNRSQLKLFLTNQPDFNHTNIKTIHHPLAQSHTDLSHTKQRETK